MKKAYSLFLTAFFIVSLFSFSYTALAEETALDDTSSQPYQQTTEAAALSPYIKILNKNSKIELGSSVYKIKYKLYYCDTDNVTFSSSNRKVADVSKQGIVTGKKKGTAVIKVKVGEVYEKLKVQVVSDCLSLNADACQISMDYGNVKRYEFGKSEQGRPLEAYIIKPADGKYRKTYVMTFAIHGFEDSYKRDGKVLTEEANKLVRYYAGHPSKLNGFRLVIVPCLNPDGTIAGLNNFRAGSSNAFGRCNAKHIDLNRDFKSGRFKAAETKAMVRLLDRFKPDLFTDFHGWMNLTMGNKTLCHYFDRALSLGNENVGSYNSQYGYLLGFVKNKYKCPSVLVEYKSPRAVSHKKTYKAINNILSHY